MHPWLLVINSHWKADGVFQLMCDTNFVKSMILCTLICKANKRTHARLRSFRLCLAKVDAFLDLYSNVQLFRLCDRWANRSRGNSNKSSIRLSLSLNRSSYFVFFYGFLRLVQHYRWPNGTFKRWDIDRDRSSQTRWNDWIKRENKKNQLTTIKFQREEEYKVKTNKRRKVQNIVVGFFFV